MPLSNERQREKEQWERNSLRYAPAERWVKALLTAAGVKGVEQMNVVELHLRFHDYLLSLGESPQHPNPAQVWGCVPLPDEEQGMETELGPSEPLSSVLLEHLGVTEAWRATHSTS